eukprot:TRINITY_DN61263_c0_g1_i1.p1 TRINITY_DN61263_c0_g1~~TRINITY_DN61263_c0_g1_i1.p1  ORF type:complete len:480 (+),score=47.74 TRINITY_DN61263_c0_g1_i1:30-1469(+)
MQPFLSARTLADKIRAKEITAVDALEHFIQRVQKYDPTLNCVVVRDFDRARQRAKEADNALAEGTVWGPLHGVPLTVKESKDIRGLVTCKGVASQKDAVVTGDNSPAVVRLLDAGAVIFGKTNVPVDCLDWETYNPVYGATPNPWDTTRTPGGSSGGGSAAVAAGLTPVEVGSDVAGSIRVPATFCGIVGHQPTYDLIPYYTPGQISGTRDMAVVGPLARTTDDIELLMDVLSGLPDCVPKECAKLDLLRPVGAKQLKEYRIGIIETHPQCPPGADVSAAVAKVKETLQAAGVEFRSTSFPKGLDPMASLEVYMKLLGAKGSTTLPLPKDLPVDDPIITWWEQGRRLTHLEWIGLNKKRFEFQHMWQMLFKDVDVVIYPVCCCSAFKSQQPEGQTAYAVGRKLEIDGKQRNYSDMFFWPHFAIFGGFPATAVPVKTGSELPVGVQVMGPPLSDLTCVSVGGLIMEATGHGEYGAPPDFQ